MRKARSLGNFSIETSYRTMGNAWPSDSPRPEIHTASRFTSGIRDRSNPERGSATRPSRAPHHRRHPFRRHRPPPRPVVLTIHDLGMLEEGSALKRRLKRWFWLTLPLRSCDRLIAVSETTRQDILRRTDYPQDQILVIPSVISPTFRKRATEPSHPTPRVLHIGLADNKNLQRHAEALAGLEVHLRIIGEPSQAGGDAESHGIEFSTASKRARRNSKNTRPPMLLFCSTWKAMACPSSRPNHRRAGGHRDRSTRLPGWAVLADPDGVLHPGGRSPDPERGRIQSRADRQGPRQRGRLFSRAVRPLHAELYRALVSED